MPLISINVIKGKPIRKLNDMKEYKCSDDDVGAIIRHFMVNVEGVWGDYSSLNEYEQTLMDILSENYNIPSFQFPRIGIDTNYITACLYDNYGERYLLHKYFEMYSSWDGSVNDYNWLYKLMDTDVKTCIKKNRYKWGNLMKSCMLEFNPLWNVDGEEITTRTLEQDGTITLRKRGTETDSEDVDATISRTGTDTDKKTGTETSAKTGTEANVTDEETVDSKTGTETSAKTGAEQITYDTEEKKDIDGSEATTHKKAITNEESVTTTESTEYFETKKNVETGSDDDNVDTLEYSPDRADTLTKTGTETTSFNNRQDQTTYNTTDTVTHDGEETTTYNTQEQTTHNTTDTVTHNTQDTEERTVDRTTTHNTDDTTTRDLLDTERTTFERHGNIGVTTTTALLTEFREYVNFNIIDVIAHDIANAITESVY